MTLSLYTYIFYICLFTHPECCNGLQKESDPVFIWSRAQIEPVCLSVSYSVAKAKCLEIFYFFLYSGTAFVCEKIRNPKAVAGGCVSLGRWPSETASRVNIDSFHASREEGVISNKMMERHLRNK